MAESVRLGPAGDVPEGGGRQYEAAGKPVAVFRCEGTLHALEGSCPHRGGPLGEGTLEGGVVTCPWHGWRFDVRTGACLPVPEEGLVRYPVREEDGGIVVELPDPSPEA